MNKKTITTILMFVLLIGGITAGTFLVQQNQNLEEKAAPLTTISFNPNAATIVRGQNFTTSSRISTSTNKVTGVDIEITYNPAVVQLTQLLPTSALAPFTNPQTGSVIKNEINNQTGNARFIAYTLNRDLGILGTNLDILTISGQVLSNATPGAYQLTYGPLTAIAAVGESQNAIISKTNYALTVAAPTPSPTVSPTPSPTPSPSPTASPSPTPTPVRTITVTSPNGGESYIYGNPFAVTWNSTQNFGNVDIILEQVNSGGNPTSSLTAQNQTNTGSFSWSVFPSGTFTFPGSFRVRVQASDNVTYVNVFDRSNSNFTISLPTPSPSPTASPSPTPTASPSPTPSPIVYPNWDVDQNGLINVIDIGLVIDHYDSTSPANPRADVDRNGRVNIVDIGIIIDHYQ